MMTSTVLQVYMDKAKGGQTREINTWWGCRQKRKTTRTERKDRKKTIKFEL